MKLEELLKVIPEQYLIGLADADADSQFITFGNKKDAVMSYCQRAPMTPGEVKNLNVIEINSGVKMYLTSCDTYCEDEVPLHIKTKILIYVRPEEK